MSTCVITTCNLKGWSEYGRRMVRSFVRYWPNDVTLVLYAEDFEPDFDGMQPANVIVAGFPLWFLRWKERHAEHLDAHGRDPQRNPPRRKAYNFKRDCVKFAHKVAAIVDGALDEPAETVIWIDADTVTHQPVDQEWLYKLFPLNSPAYMAWLDRLRPYPECGFLMFRTGHSEHERFMDQMRRVYESDLVFKLPETHDSYVFQQIVKSCRFSEPYSLSGPGGRTKHHVFVNSPLAERLDHLKGERKKKGRTPSREAGGRSEPYWRRG